VDHFANEIKATIEPLK